MGDLTRRHLMENQHKLKRKSAARSARHNGPGIQPFLKREMIELGYEQAPSMLKF